MDHFFKERCLHFFQFNKVLTHQSSNPVESLYHLSFKAAPRYKTSVGESHSLSRTEMMDRHPWKEHTTLHQHTRKRVAHSGPSSSTASVCVSKLPDLPDFLEFWVNFKPNPFNQTQQNESTYPTCATYILSVVGSHKFYSMLIIMILVNIYP